MKSLSFVFKNIKTFFLHHTVMFFFLIVVQIICCVTVFIVCGMANNMYYVEDTGKNVIYTDASLCTFDIAFGEAEDLDFTISSVYDSKTGKNTGSYIVKGQRVDFIDYSTRPSVAELRPLLDTLPSAIGDDFAYITLIMAYNEKAYSKDIGKIPLSIISIIPGNFHFDSGDAFNYLNKNVFSGGRGQYGDTVTINGIEYVCVLENDSLFSIPYNSLQDCFRVCGVSVTLTEIPTAARRIEVQNIINDTFGEDVRFTGKPAIYDPSERQIGQMVYVISIVIMIIIIFALAKFYNYILSNRQNSLVVLRLCGGTKKQIHLIYMIEIFLTMILTSALGFVIFKYLCYQPIVALYPSFKVFFTPDIYITILAAYIILSLIIMAITIIPTTKASIIDMKRG